MAGWTRIVVHANGHLENVYVKLCIILPSRRMHTVHHMMSGHVWLSISAMYFYECEVFVFTF